MSTTDPTAAEAVLLHELHDAGAGHNSNGYVPPGRLAACSDLANARRLTAVHGDDLHYVAKLNHWITWAGTHWAEDVTGQVDRWAKDSAQAIVREVDLARDEESAKRLRQWWAKSQDRPRIRAMADLAATEPGVTVTVNELDIDPWALALPNGTLNLRTGSLRASHRNDLITKLAPVAYDPDAKAPIWERFLGDVFCGDNELIGFVQRSFGIALTGDTSEQYLWVPYGSGANGKSTLIHAIRHVIGPYGTALDPRLLMATHNDQHPTGLTDLRGVRFAATVEVEDGRWLAESLVKQLTGGDAIKARRMHGDFFEFLPTHKLWLATNHLPHIKGTDLAIWRRILLVPFERTFEPEERDKTLPDKLAHEAPGILAWAVRGCLDWQAGGLGVPTRVQAATTGYRRDEDHVGRFLEECCELIDGDAVSAKALRDNYETWCQTSGERPWSAMALGRELTRRGLHSEKAGRANTKHWFGVRLLDTLRLEDQ